MLSTVLWYFLCWESSEVLVYSPVGHDWRIWLMCITTYNGSIFIFALLMICQYMGSYMNWASTLQPMSFQISREFCKWFTIVQCLDSLIIKRLSYQYKIPIINIWTWECLIIPPTSMKLKGGYTGFTLSVCPSGIVSALYLQQYSSDPYYICTPF